MFRFVTSFSSNIFCGGYLEHQSLWVMHRPSPNHACGLPCPPLLLLHEISGERKPDPVSWMGNKEPGSSWVLFLQHSSSLCGPGLFLKAPIQPTITALCSWWDPEHPTELRKSTESTLLCLGLKFLVPSVLVPMCCARHTPRMERNEGSWKMGVSIWVSRCSL